MRCCVHGWQALQQRVSRPAVGRPLPLTNQGKASKVSGSSDDATAAVKTLPSVDTNGDGIADTPILVDTDGDGIPETPATIDTDGDGKPDSPAAHDTDGDGKPDTPAVVDTDGDGDPDSPVLVDTDDDGVPDRPATPDDLIPPANPTPTPAPGGGSDPGTGGDTTIPEVPGASDDDVAALHRCFELWGENPFGQTATNFRRINASVTVGGFGNAINKRAQPNLTSF